MSEEWLVEDRFFDSIMINLFVRRSLKMVSLDDIKLPPHNIDAERGILSCILLDNDVMFICDGLMMVPEDYYQKEHQMIFEAMRELWGHRKTIDVITLADMLVKKQYFDVI